MSVCNLTTAILGSECIGNSLVTINTNFDNLDTAVCDLSASSGHILQVKQVAFDSTLAISAITWTSLSGLSVAITPSSTTSKFLVSVHLQGLATYYNALRFMRDSTPIGIGEATYGPLGVSQPRARATFAMPMYSAGATGGYNDGTMYSVSNSYLDAPTMVDLTPITYGIQGIILSAYIGYSLGSFYINRDRFDVPEYWPFSCRALSTMTVMEVKQ